MRFVAAGDAYYYERIFKKMNAQIAKTDPDFIVVGGDIAYTNNHWTLFKGKGWEERRWGTFFSEWKKSMVGVDGRLIPLVAVLGNHDIKKGGEGIPLFFQLFAMPEKLKAYRTLNFGTYLSLIILDTGHFTPIRGEQTTWLEGMLKRAGRDRGYTLVAYHIAAYPSVYQYDGAAPSMIRREWVPLFEEYGVDTAFEHHNHAYKRTYRIKEGKVDASGVQYLGDGAWGVSPRAVNKGLWYMAKSAKLNCFWLVTLDNNTCTFESRDIRGRVIETIISQKTFFKQSEF
jgi:3',5'-cyclic AMP phosphodiesterase CpdA